MFLCSQILRARMKNVKFTVITALLFATLGLFSSCIGEEPLNAECDIEMVTLTIDNPLTVFYHAYDAQQIVPSANDSVGFLAHIAASIGAYPVTLKTTAGAKPYLLDDSGVLQPFSNGMVVDFSGGQIRHFHIVSEDGKWSRDYKINIVNESASGSGTMLFNFDDFELNEPSHKYYVWRENTANAISYDQWATGNPGFNLSKSSAKPDEYPSVAVAAGGVDGGAYLKLETKDTGSFGRMVKMPLASGSLFIGTFDVSNALKDALSATRFGLPFKHKPTRVTGYYKFHRGEIFQDKTGAEVLGRLDMPDAYCVFYRSQDNEGNPVVLDGADVLTSEYIVGIARIVGVMETDTWTPFEMRMEYLSEVDKTLLASNGYNMTLCFASSIDGAYFEGAVGNTFCIDQVILECEY